MLSYILLLCILCVSGVVPSILPGEKEQTVAVNGTLLCGTQPLTDAEIKLWDEDIWPDPDDLMGTAYTDSRGSFFVSGTETEMTSIDPVLKIYHNCNNRWPCKRKVRFTIPDSYINPGRNTSKVYLIGSINMEMKFHDEERDCF